MTHTPEPWYADIRSGCAAIYPANERNFAEGLHPVDHGRTIIVWQRGTEDHPDLLYPIVSDLDKANLCRIVDCVNACEGMNDPAAELASLRAEVNRLRGALGRIRDEHASDGHFCRMCGGAGGRWPCATYLEANDAFNPLPKESPHAQA